MCLHALVIKEIPSLIFIIQVFIFSHLSFPFSLLPLHPTIFDHYGMKNITEPYVNSWSYQCKFLPFFRGGEFLACTISLCDVFIFPNAAVCLMVYFIGHCPQKNRNAKMITVLSDAVFLFQEFHIESFNTKPNAPQNLLWKQLSEQLED